MEEVIRASGLVKRFKRRTALDGLSLSVKQGELFGLVGPNGAGKTTLIRTLCGLLRPDEGEAHLLGWRVPSFRIQSQLGYMPQDFAVYDDLTVMQTLRFFGALYDLSRQDVEARGQELLELVQLTDRRDQHVGTLSGGMRRRVSLAVSLIHKPRLLFLDEPTAGVDPKLRRSFWDYFNELAGEDVTMVVSTHLIEEASRCGLIGFLIRGRLLVQAPPEEILSRTGTDSLDDAFLALQEQQET